MPADLASQAAGVLPALFTQRGLPAPAQVVDEEACHCVLADKNSHVESAIRRRVFGLDHQGKLAVCGTANTWLLEYLEYFSTKMYYTKTIDY